MEGGIHIPFRRQDMGSVLGCLATMLSDRSARCVGVEVCSPRTIARGRGEKQTLIATIL